MRKLFVILTAVLLTKSAFAQTLLADFGANAGANIYNTVDFPGWQNVTLSSTTHYSSDGGVAGTCMTIAPIDGNQFSNFTCISGNARDFVRGERIFMTWYNNSPDSFSFNPLISFSDNNNPVNDAGQPLWFIVGQFEDFWISPGETIVTWYDITDATNAGPMFPMSAGNHSMLNVCVNTVAAGLILDKIEIGIADIIAPETPQNLHVSQTTSNSIKLAWSSVSDNPGGDGFKHYEIFVNGLSFGTSQTPEFAAYLLEPGKVYSFRVRATDNRFNHSSKSAVLTHQTLTADYSSDLINPYQQFIYKGAFRLPDTGVGTNFNYMEGDPAYFPQGDPSNTDAYPGSIFIAGDATYRFVAEINIPEPVISPSKNLNDLNQSEYLQNFADIASPNIKYAEWGWKKGPAIEYLPAQNGQSQGYLYTCHGEYYAWGGERYNSFGACNTNLSNPSPVGGWIIGPSTDGMESPHYMTFISFLFSMPKALNQHLLVAGGSRPGNLHNGPTLVAYSPWNDGTPLPANNTMLDYSVLLMYDDDMGTNRMNAHSYCDYWNGGAWLGKDNRQSVAISGVKGRGLQWYGYNNGESTSNVMYNVPTPIEPESHGPRQSYGQPLLLFYNPQDLIDVANGTKQSYEPQPYAAMDLQEYFFFPNNHTPEYIADYKGAGGIAFDRESGILYVFERGVTGNDNSVSIVHVWQLNSVSSAEKPMNNDKVELYYADASLFFKADKVIIHATIEVYSVIGQKVADFEISEKSFAQFNLSIPNGMYIVKVQFGSKAISQKIWIGN